MTLEWLLIVAAIAGVAAFSVLAVQRIVDDTTERPPPDEVRIVDAEIEAAKVAHDANLFTPDGVDYLTSSPENVEFQRRCEIEVPSRFTDVVASGDWRPPKAETDPDTDPYEPAKCILKRR